MDDRAYANNGLLSTMIVEVVKTDQIVETDHIRTCLSSSQGKQVDDAPKAPVPSMIQA